MFLRTNWESAAPLKLPKKIRAAIYDRTSLTASAGVAPNKFLAKIASDMNKPDGITVIRPSMVAGLLSSLPVRKVPGIGKVTERKMRGLGIRTTADLQRKSEAELLALFGKSGRWYFNISRGIDARPVNSNRVRKSVSAEDTFSEDSTDIRWLREQLSIIADRVARRLDTAGTAGRSLTLKVTYSDFSKATRSRTLQQPFADPATIAELAHRLLVETEAGERPIRLLGIGVSSLDTEQAEPKADESGLRQLEFDFGA